MARNVGNRRAPSARGWLLAAAVALGVVCAAPAHASAIFFSPSVTYGFSASDPNLPDAFGEVDFDERVLAANQEFAASFDLALVLNQSVSPVNRPQDVGENPSVSNPYIADVTFEITNDTAQAMVNAVLALAGVFGSYLDDVPLANIGLDLGAATDLGILQMHDGGTTYHVPAFVLGPLAPGQTVTMVARYIVTGGVMPSNASSGVELPPISVTGFTDFEAIEEAPEPVEMVLLGLGLAALSMIRRRA